MMKIYFQVRHRVHGENYKKTLCPLSHGEASHCLCGESWPIELKCKGSIVGNV